MASRSLGRMARLTNMQISIDSSGSKCHVKIPGFSYDDFDRTGNLNPWKLQRLLTACRIFAYHHPNEQTGSTFLEYDKLTSDKYTFMASTKTFISRTFYNLASVEKVPHFSVSVHLGYVGTSSLNSVAVLSNSDTGEELARNTNQVVTVSKKTRKPTPLSDWWKEKYASSVVENERLIVNTLSVPSNTHKYCVKVVWSDTDAYKHTNYVSYIKYCFDAASDAVVNGQMYSNLKNDALNYHVKQMEVSYKGETNAGDELIVSTWQNEQDPWKIHFDISRNNTTVFQMTSDYYDS